MAPKVYGYGPDGPWEQVTQPPIFSVLKAHAVPSNKRGLALATAIAVQNKVRPSRDGHALEHICGIYIIALRLTNAVAGCCRCTMCRWAWRLA